MLTLEQRMELRKRVLKEQEEKKVEAKLGTIARKSIKQVGVVSDLARWQGEITGADCDLTISDWGNEPEYAN